MSGNTNLHKAKKEKNDEFFTLYEDIEKETVHYKQHFKGKTVYCNCDDYRRSNFWKYFYDNFNELQLKKLTATNYNIGEGAYRADYDGKDTTVTKLEGNGDFRSAECVEYLKEADIVVTNPPFSLFKEYITQLMDFNKKFIIVGNKNAVTYKEVFSLIKDNKMWVGFTPMGYDMKFILPKHFAEELVATKKEGSAYVIENGNVLGRAQAVWFTNLEHEKRNRPIDLYKHYSNEYKHYDNYDAIEVGKVCEIPMDYDGVMGVPITFLDKYCPDQFEIVGGFNAYKECDYENGLLCGQKTEYIDKNGNIKIWTGPTINKKTIYARILIRHRK